jgi:hypothetical protein
MFQLELYSEGEVLSKVVMNWKKYYVYNYPSHMFLYLNEDGIFDINKAFDSYYTVRGTYKSSGPLKNVEVRICKFFPNHDQFFIKEMSLKATYH